MRFARRPLWSRHGGSERGEYAKGLYVEITGRSAYVQVLATRTDLPAQPPSDPAEWWVCQCERDLLRLTYEEVHRLEECIKEAIVWGGSIDGTPFENAVGAQEHGNW